MSEGEELDNGDRPDPLAEDRDAAVRFVLESLRLQEFRILDHGGDDPVFTCWANGLRIPPLDLERLADQKSLRLEIAKVTRRWFPYFKPDQWAEVADALLAIAEDVTGDSSDAAEVRAMILTFLVSQGDVVLDLERPNDKRRAVDTPITAFRLADGSVYLRLTAFHDHCLAVHEVLDSKLHLLKRLARLGFSRPWNSDGKLNVRVGELQVQGRYLASSPGFFHSANEDA